ncbi:Acetyltransferase (GNAT) family protein [Falsiruegeria litorea R37]|uniref:Acetyltransferase (GNAT) family protein n=1 Tax=Falsiruegeria litorea R37 TaxID=1200284 RepID=A0A1Y5S3X1_9RHOB|nr:GNAT family N-acetyltransferase [Falsiruegeria litorea]SLN29178.1 Acetyltransferase (GNAT) family protein [Falsiruegeria litorea R37]
MTVQLVLNALPGAYAVTRRARNMPVPDWAHGEGLVSVTQAPDETSILCLEDRVPAAEQCSGGWQAVQVSNLVDLDVPGVVLSAVQPISQAGLGIFVTSTFDRDYLLVRAAESIAARMAWITAGHHYCDGKVTYRLAMPSDGEALAQVHFETWQETYAKIAPPEVRLALNLAHRKRYWQARLETAAQTLVAEVGGRIIGLCALSGCAAEVDHLYVLNTARGAGVGAHLLRLARNFSATVGNTQVTLAVVKENTQAVGFYAAQGGRVVAEKQDKGPLWKSDNLIFGWPVAKQVATA